MKTCLQRPLKYAVDLSEGCYYSITFDFQSFETKVLNAYFVLQA